MMCRIVHPKRMWRRETEKRWEDEWCPNERRWWFKLVC